MGREQQHNQVRWDEFHPRRPRGSQSGRVKRRDKSFQAWAELFRLWLKTFFAPFLPARLTAPWVSEDGRILEFITSKQDALHLTRGHCAPFYQNTLRHEQLKKVRWVRACIVRCFLCVKFSTVRLEVLPNLRNAGVFQMSTMDNLGLDFNS